MSEMSISLVYKGKDADINRIDMYDAAEALMGFQRSLALTAHYVLNGEIITQAPSLKGARILTESAEPGSWKTTAVVVTGLFAMGTAPKDTPIGHLIHSAYDYVISEAMGFHVNYEESLLETFKKAKDSKQINHEITQDRLDGVVEKCIPAITSMHRPIVYSGTASQAALFTYTPVGNLQVGGDMDVSTFDYLDYTVRGTRIGQVRGVVSSYNANTFKGRIYVKGHQRSVPFELAEDAQDLKSVGLVAASLESYATRTRTRLPIPVAIRAYRDQSRTGRLKGFRVVAIEPAD